MFKQLFGKHPASRSFTNKAAQTAAETSNQRIYPLVQDNLQAIKQSLHHPSDLVIRSFTVGPSQTLCATASIDGLVDTAQINEQLLKPMMHSFDYVTSSAEEMCSVLEQQVLSTYQVKRIATMDDVIYNILSGNTVLFINESPDAIAVTTIGWKSRAIEEPQTESIIRGPRAGFTEDLRTNTAMIRRRMKEPNLVFDNYQIGRRGKRDVVIAYIVGIVHPDLVKEITKRVQSIDIDDIDGSGFLEHWIADSFLSPFPLILNTERPDKVTTSLLQGRVAILVDGDPFALILPITFSSSLHSPEDYYQHWMISSLTRVLRLGAAFIATFLPALYVALLEYHHGMIPSKLAFSIAGAREGVPFPAVVEAFAMEITLELLREAGLRLPKPIGQTIGIVGGLVIGEAAVAAGMVSPVMVIVVAITAIASFALPSYSFAITLRMIRFGIMLAAAFFGLFGIILTYIMINVHITNLMSFGIPYSTPFAPLLKQDWKDLILRVPTIFLKRRPEMMQPQNPDRMKKESDPS